MGLVIVLALLSLITFCAGCGVAAFFMVGTIHGVEALVLFLISSVFFVGAAILASLVDIERRLKKGPEPREP
jgi:hypothetical protein